MGTCSGRKRTRLDVALYSDPTAVCLVTACTRDRAPFFRPGPLATACVDLLIERAQAGNVSLLAFCLMPDHLHLLVSPGNGTSIVTFVGEFKSLSTRIAWGYGVAGRIWQQGFYDHFLRREEDIEETVRYILANPVRRGIVEDWRAYPYCGSLVYDL